MFQNSKKNGVSMIEYVVGFLFSEDRESVCLIRKNKPEWQRGLLNGIGGLIEADEEAHEAMIREFAEETGVTHHEWSPFATLENEEVLVHFYKAFSTKVIEKVYSPTEEKVKIVPVELLDIQPTIPNLQWLIPMALDDKTIHAQVAIGKQD